MNSISNQREAAWGRSLNGNAIQGNIYIEENCERILKKLMKIYVFMYMYIQ